MTTLARSPSTPPCWGGQLPAGLSTCKGFANGANWSASQSRDTQSPLRTAAILNNAGNLNLALDSTFDCAFILRRPEDHDPECPWRQMAERDLWDDLANNLEEIP